METYVLVSQKKPIWKNFIGYLLFGLAIASLSLACVGMVFAYPLAIVFGALGFLLVFRSDKEFEYSYFDGDVNIAKVMNKSRRKRLDSFTMDEVILIAPAGDRSVYKYENDANLKKKDYTCGEKDAPFYEMIVNKNGNMSMIKFEPDEKFLNEICKKYAQKVTRRPSGN